MRPAFVDQIGTYQLALSTAIHLLAKSKKLVFIDVEEKQQISGFLRELMLDDCAVEYW